MLLPRGDRIGPVEAAQAGDRVPQARAPVRQAATRETRARPSPRRPRRRPSSSSDCARSARGTDGRLSRRPAAPCSPARAVRLSVDRDRWRRPTAIACPASACSTSACGSHAENSPNESRGACRNRAICSGFVAPDRLDQRRAGRYAAGDDLPHQRRRFERHAAARQRADDQQPLAPPQVQTDFHGELAVRLELSFAIGHHGISVAHIPASNDAGTGVQRHERCPRPPCR